ncbi:coiled-coil domain-containing protein [Duganella violaceipulchra]|uniref:CCDC90 family protein n=1 Tax=Duganella violaceipulchra TaxID=2849652 RepID=A0AA41H8M7_9BURK|nr:coiled-coil domain-containing protein [Duganella violaceicalia]MBV6322649.1 CCDC90 family protein [Duganella violaceicalia]MCP2010863.1 hypothetical protein [Duganella violaceicalia]
MNGTFDTLSYTRRLEAAGVPPEQAEAHALALSEALRMQLATKADLQLCKTELSHKIDLCRTDLTNKIGQVRTELIDRIELVRIELNDKIELVRAELNDKIELVRAELNARMDKMEAKHAADFAELRALVRDEIHGLRTEIMRWVIGLWIGQSAVLFAALAYFRT